MGGVRQWHAVRYGATELPAVLCLHGFLGRGDDWAEVATALCDTHHFLCPDLPYHGGTVADRDVPMACADTADALAAWLQDAGVARCTVVGYSMGGRIALHLAVQHPGLVERLVLESASPGIDDDNQRDQRRIQDARTAHELESLADASALRAWVRSWYAQPLFERCALYPARLAALIDRRCENHPAALAASLRGMGTGSQASLWSSLAQIEAPTLLIAGESDRKFLQIAEQMQERNPAFAIEVLHATGHNVHWERPDRYTTVLKGFLPPPCGATP